MLKRTSSLTLENIGKLIDEKFDSKFAENNELIFSRFEGIDDRLNAQSQRITETNQLINDLIIKFHGLIRVLEKNFEKKFSNLEQRLISV